jgi:hypothetical protein
MSICREMFTKWANEGGKFSDPIARDMFVCWHQAWHDCLEMVDRELEAFSSPATRDHIMNLLSTSQKPSHKP